MNSKSCKRLKDISNHNNIPKIQYKKVTYERQIILVKVMFKTNNVNINKITF